MVPEHLPTCGLIDFGERIGDNAFIQRLKALRMCNSLSLVAILVSEKE
jgi:hypothetical protein